MHEQGVATVVLGVGNPLLTDEGTGVAALRMLTDQWDFEPPVELIDGGTWGLSLLPAVESADRLLIVDAIDVAAVPGTQITLEREQLPRLFAHKLSPHQIDLREVLALAELRGKLPGETVALGIQPASLEWSAELSPTIQREMPALLQRVLERLAHWGHQARPVARHA